MTCKAISGSIEHRNINPNVNQGFHQTGKSLEHLTDMLQNVMSSWRDVMTWRHDVILTCKAITGDIQHKNVIPNSIPGFDYTGKSLGHLTTCCYRRMTSWRVYMTSTWHGKLLLALFQLFCLSRDNNWTLWHAYNKIGQKSRCHDELNLQSSFYVE